MNLPAEMVEKHGYGFSADWFSLGVLSYVLLFGKHPALHSAPKVTSFVSDVRV